MAKRQGQSLTRIPGGGHGHSDGRHDPPLTPVKNLPPGKGIPAKGSKKK